MTLEEWTNQTLHGRIQYLARREPEWPAILTDGIKVSYGELEEKSNLLAKAMATAGAKQGNRVALLLPHSPSLAVAWVAALKSGAICVPIPVEQPIQRIGAIVEDAEPFLIVSDSANVELARQLPPTGGGVLDLEALPGSNTEHDNLPSVTPHSDAYILYTSGTTGRPKGVIQTHRNLLRNVHGLTALINITSGDRLAGLTSISMGQGVATLFNALLNGATYCPFPLKERGFQVLVPWLKRHRISIYTSAVSVFRAFAGSLSSDDVFPDLRVVRLGAEELQVADVELFRERFGDGCTLFNTLGCTETMNYSAYRIDHQTKLESASVPAGYPPEATHLLIMDKDGRELADGTVGEIVVESDYLSPGYWRHPELTERSFFQSADGRRRYRTGDRGRRLPTGALEVRGRLDHQVKVRGFRVELGEIESVLINHPQVTAAAAVSVHAPADELIAYVVTDLPNLDVLREYLRETLPSHMVPNQIMRLEQLPVAPSGKVDRNALPAPVEPSDKRGEHDFQATEWEGKIASLWRKVLGKEFVGLEQDFMAIGGDSLSALRLFAEVEASLGVEFNAVDVFETFTISSMAAKAEIMIEGKAGQSSTANNDSSRFLVPLRKSRTRETALFLPGGWGGDPEILIMAGIVRQLNCRHSIFGVRSRAMDPNRPGAQLLETRAQAILDEIAKELPTEAPLILVGECVAGALTLELASKVEKSGHQLDRVILLDPWTPKGTSLFERLRRPSSNDQLPVPIQEYYRMLKRAKVGIVESEIHLVVCSDTKEARKTIDYWRAKTRSRLFHYQVKGTHDSYIRGESAETVELLNSLIMGVGGTQNPKPSKTYPA